MESVSTTRHMQPSRPAAAAPAEAQSVWGKDGFGFDDLLDIVNPLQHLPGIGQVYRHLAGDELGMLPRIAGGALFGGPVGAATSIVAAGVEAGTGKTPGEHMFAALQSEPPPVPAPSRVAAAYRPPAASLPSPTPHADVVVGAAASRSPRAPEFVALPDGWAPPVSGASQRLLAELERNGAASADRAG